MARGVDCTEPDELLAQFPCLARCTSTHELWVILMGMFAVAQDLDGDLDALKTYGAKYRNLDERTFLIGLISALPTWWFAELTEENLQEDFGCATCWSESEVKAVLLYLWCLFWESYTAPD